MVLKFCSICHIFIYKIIIKVEITYFNILISIFYKIIIGFE